MLFRSSNLLSSLFASIAGALLAIWLRYVGPDTTLSFEIMLDVLLIVVIGGMGTIYGALIGSVLFVLAQNYLQDLLMLLPTILAKLYQYINQKNGVVGPSTIKPVYY